MIRSLMIFKEMIFNLLPPYPSWLKGAVLKTVRWVTPTPGFESQRRREKEQTQHLLFLFLATHSFASSFFHLSFASSMVCFRAVMPRILYREHM